VKAAEITPASRVALALTSLVAVLWLLVLQVDRVSPGPLSAVHGQEAGLLERKACSRCHGEAGLPMADACAECHAEVTSQIAAHAGFHGTLAGVDTRNCAQCHGEHVGEEFELVSARSFALAGFATREAYDHDALDFRLQGRHVQLGCKDCHANADVVLLPKGELRFAGLDQGCQKCHEDAHQGRIVRACGECHGQEHPFQLVASFAHQDFESECAHGAQSCEKCHPRGTSFDAELLAGRDPPDCKRSCQDCHVSPHGESFTAASAVLAELREGDSCKACHSERMGTFAGHPEEMPPELHAASGFALDRPHQNVACAACHQELVGDALSSFSVHQPARSSDECRGCHGDPHEGQFASGAFAGADCLACHERTAFEPSRFDVEQHARSAFPLAGSHQAVACARCHLADPPGAPRVFHGTPDTCAECHADAHAGAFDAELARAKAVDGCAHCHQPTLFAEFDEERFDHGDWTGFALDGAHERAECTACHEPRARPDENGRTFGVIAEVFAGPAERCVTCHVDAHDGRFDRAGMPSEVDGKQDCARCHSSESFDAVPAGFEHERWTGYPMADFHAKVECAKCHLPAPTPDAAGRTFGRAPVKCADCHADPHVGQFAVKGRTDCARCHQDAGGNAFDHQRDSRFQLDEVHQKVECAKCHVPWPLPGGGEAVRYKPLGVECADCHDPDFLERAERDARRSGKRAGPPPRGGQR